MNRVILRIPSGALYFSFIEGVGFAHMYGAGEARLSDGSTIELRD